MVGSVVAAAVAFPPGFRIDGLTDSKKLSEKKREALYNQITSECYWSFAQSNSNEIDQINILEATMLAMKKAVEQLMLLIEDDSQTIRVLVDGNRCPDLENCRAIIKGDLTEPVISADITGSVKSPFIIARQFSKSGHLFPSTRTLIV